MKAGVSFGSGGRWLTAAALVFATCSGFCETVTTEPSILKTSVSGKSLIVTASVPKGWQSITLESREVPDQGAWVPRQVLRSRKLATKVTFRLSASFTNQTLRVRGEQISSYPLTFFRGKRAFPGRRSSLWRANPGSGDVYTLTGDGNPIDGSNLPGIPDHQRSVEESDIWKISGDTLYFFNQYRGLQVIDVSHPDAPVLRGELNLPAVGDQMYLLGAEHVVLLARNGSATEQSLLSVVDVSGAQPRPVATLTMEGSVLESRLVGTALYVAVQSYLDVTDSGGTEGQWGTSVCSFDLSQPASPVERSTLWFPGYGNAVMATDRFLFVALQGGSDDLAHEVRVIDIGAPDGSMSDASGIVTAGRVTDKFKMNLAGNVFTVISERYDPKLDTEPPTGIGTWLTALETFSLANASKPAALGTLQLAPGERLYATRFEGNRAYAVTFQNIDPLWILDLTDPTQPAVAGEVEVPGWSSYIHPLGGRLVTVGMESGRVAVSLFDVRDPAKAGLLARVALGEDASWSEANWNEKALSVLEKEGLILVPFEGWNGSVYASNVQLIELADSSLTARGVISQSCQPRRTALHRNRLLSLSGKELLSVDITNRDQPTVKSALELSWAVNRILASGDYLLQMEEPGLWTAGGHSMVRVAAKTAPDVILNRVDLGALPIVGACVRDHSLYLLQNPDSRQEGLLFATETEGTKGTVTTNLLLTVMDLGALPEIHAAGQVGVPSEETASGRYEAVWPAQDLLVWVSQTYDYRTLLTAIGTTPTTAANPAATDLIGLWRGPWWSPGGVRLVAFKTKDPASPELVSQHLYAPSSAWGFSAPFVAQGRVYFSHEQSEDVPVYGKYGKIDSEWRVREFLDVIDFADPALPTERPAISIPGQLVGLSPDGALLYLLGSSGLAYSADWSNQKEALFACTYDGVGAYQVTSLALPKTWPRPVRVDKGNVFLGRAAADEKGTHSIESWSLSDTGRFVFNASAAVKDPASEIVCFGGLLALQGSLGGVAMFDASDPAQMKPCGESPAPGVWVDVGRACGSLAEGVWIPVDDFGLMSVPREYDVR